MSPISDAELRAAQAGLVRLAARDLKRFWASLDLSRPEAARDALLAFMPELAALYGDQAAAAAAEWYDDMRDRQGIPGPFRARLAAPVDTERVEARVRSASGALFTPTADAALVALTYSLSRYVLEPGRHTITRSAIADPQASGWRRVAHSRCPFCLMLAGRGGVYKEASVLFAAHGDCNCTAVPEFDPDAPEVDVRLYEASKRTANMTPEQRAKHTERVREWMDAFIP